DDLLFPEALDELCRLLEAAPGFTFATARRVIVDALGRETKRPVTYQTDTWIPFEPAAIGQHLARNVSNPFGELSNVLIRRSAFEDASCLDQVAGLPIRRLTMLGLMVNAAGHGPCAASAKVLTASRDTPDPSAQANAPDFALTLLDREVCLRA